MKVDPAADANMIKKNISICSQLIENGKPNKFGCTEIMKGIKSGAIIIMMLLTPVLQKLDSAIRLATITAAATGGVSPAHAAK